MNVRNILISQPAPAASSPYTDIISKYGVNIDFNQFFYVQPVTAREFRAQRVEILEHTAIVFSSKSTIDAFFSICEETRVAVPETMKYFCTTEAIALYLQKHIVYRKRKIFFGKGTIDSVIESIGTKHKNETFLIAATDSTKPDVLKAFTRAKLKFQSAVFCKTMYSDMKEWDFHKYQIVVCYSPLDVKSLVENHPEFEQKDLKFLAFGPATAKALKDAGYEVEITAPTPEAPSVAQALLLYLEKNK